jgi:hypothetical protein
VPKRFASTRPHYDLTCIVEWILVWMSSRRPASALTRASLTTLSRGIPGVNTGGKPRCGIAVRGARVGDLSECSSRGCSPRRRRRSPARAGATSALAAPSARRLIAAAAPRAATAASGLEVVLLELIARLPAPVAATAGAAAASLCGASPPQTRSAATARSIAVLEACQLGLVGILLRHAERE